MKRKTVVLLSSVLAGALLVGGTFAAFAVTDLASPKGVDFTPGTQEEVDYVTLDWGDHTDLKSVDEIQLNTFYKSGVLGLYSSKAYDGLLKITIADATPSAVQKDPSDPKLIDYFDVYVYEGKDADPQSAELLGKIDNPQDETQTELKLYLGGTTQGHDVTVYVRIDSALGEEGFAKVHNDVVHLEADWSKNDQSGDYDYTDRTIYVEKPAGWESINAYSWEGDKEGPAWPGKAMNVELPTGLYKTTVPAQDTNLIFNDGENKLPAPTELDPDPSYTYAGYDQNKGYIFWDGDAWQMLPVQTVDSKFSLEINDQEVPAATLAGYAQEKNGNNAVYKFAVEAGQKVEFAYDGDLIYFGGTNDLGQDTLIDTERTFDEAGTYTFYINRYNHIYVEAGEPEPGPTPVVADNIVYGSKAGAAWGKIADLVANGEGEVKALNVELAAGDKFIFHLEGDSYMKYANLKTEGTGSAHDHFTYDDEGNLVVVTGGAFDFYVLKEGEKTIWSEVHGEDPEVGYTATVNDAAYDLTGKASAFNPDVDNAAYTLALEANDEVGFKYGETVLHFYHWDEEQQKAIDDGDTYSVTEDGSYKFVINKSNEIYVTAEGVEPEGEGFALYDVTEAKQIVALAYAGKETGEKQRDQYNGQAELVKDQVITIRDLENAANFIADIEGYSFGGTTATSENWKEYLKVNEDGKSWTVLKDVNVNMYTKIAYEDNSVYIEIYTPIDPEALTTVDLWVKFPISDAQAGYPAFVWVFTNDTDGKWYVANHVAETWEATGNRHYTFQMVNPVGKQLVLAVFSSDCGFDAEHLPTSWEKVVAQSGDTDINSASVDVYGQ